MSSSTRMKANRNAFTLVELLVVIGIIGILLALLIPAVQAARAAARRAQCKSNLRQVALALHNHHDTRGSLPSGWRTEPLVFSQPGWGWLSRTLPFVEQQSVYDQITFDLLIEHQANQPAASTSIATFMCPSDRGDSTAELKMPNPQEPEHSQQGPHAFHPIPVRPHFIYLGKTNYSGVMGIEPLENQPAYGHGVFFQNSRVKFRDIHDGLSQTLIVGEQTTEHGIRFWAGVVPFIDVEIGRNLGAAYHAPNHHAGNFSDFASHHATGAHFALGDGSVRMLHHNIHIDVYRALATRELREVVELPQ